MHKIIFITDYSKRDKELVRCLKMLFAECEIEIQPNLPGCIEEKTESLNIEKARSLTNDLMSQMKA